jgi:hypothetical protein
MIASPCINICKMDEASGLCQGCYRNLAEIAAWGNASERKKILILADIARRRSAPRAAAAPAGNSRDN